MNNKQLGRFLAKVSLLTDGCWEWSASLFSNGYGQFYFDKNRCATLAHRVSYEHFVGEIPEGLQIDHLCRNRACVNPTHLDPVTNRVNSRRGAHCKESTHFAETRDKATIRAVLDKARAFRTADSFARIGAARRAHRLCRLKCRHGHLLTSTNTYWKIRKDGALYSRCKRCHADRATAQWRRDHGRTEAA